MRLRACCGVALAVACVTAWGQVSKPDTGTVTGHVICSDTQKPARFAQVMLFAVPAAVTQLPKVDAADPEAVQAVMKAQVNAMKSTTFVMSQTGFDGSFSVVDVAPGDYYVMASVAGYVQPHDLMQAAYDAGEDITKGIPSVPIVRVAAEHGTNVDVSVSKGAAVEGHVLWDDGEPVNGATVMAEPKGGEHKQFPPQFSMMSLSGQYNGATDDRGHYRISGLAPGEYTVRVMLQTARRMSMQGGHFDPNGNFGATPLLVYAPGGFRKTDAKPVTLSAGEERTDEDITFNLSATHNVSGRVTSAEDHHGLNRGVVSLTDTSDKTFRRSAGLDQDGNFNVPFVPAGTYTMTVANAADAVPEQLKPGDEEAIAAIGVNIVRSYQKADRQLIVADDDLTGQNFELKPGKAGEQESGIGAVAGGVP